MFISEEGLPIPEDEQRYVRAVVLAAQLGTTVTPLYPGHLQAQVTSLRRMVSLFRGGFVTNPYVAGTAGTVLI